MERRWISPRDAAEYMKVHVMTVYSWIDSGKIPAARIGRLVRIDLRALEADLDVQVQGTPAAVHKKRQPLLRKYKSQTKAPLRIQ
jgi:excisionase family DNA binding protein